MFRTLREWTAWKAPAHHLQPHLGLEHSHVLGRFRLLGQLLVCGLLLVGKQPRPQPARPLQRPPTLGDVEPEG
jgi:hypothetical protein